QTGKNGCFSTEVPVASLNLTSFRYKTRLYAYASLLEEGTGEHSHANSHPVMSGGGGTWRTWHNSARVPARGISSSLLVQMLLKGINGSALKEKEILLVVNAGKKIQRKTLLTDESGRASFELDTSGWNYKVTLHGELKDDAPALKPEGKEYPSSQSVTHYLYPFSSDSKSFLKIHRVEKKLCCGQPQQLGVDYLFDEKPMGIELQSLDVVFLVLAKGTIASILRKELRAEAGLRGSFSLELPIGPALAPTAKVLGYAVLPDGEMVADSIELKVAKCFPSMVNLSFSEQRALVGSQLRLKVQAAPGTLCAVYAMDQRMWSSSPKRKLNPSIVYNLLPKFSEDSSFFEDDFPPCWMDGYTDRIMHLPALNCFDVPRNSWKDCHKSLRHKRLAVSDTQPGSYILFKHIQVMPLFAEGLELDEWDTGMQMDFLGTWLWELVPVGEGGSAEVTVTVPDVITEWEAGMFCTSPQGFGLAPATTLTAYKPFFVELALPYTVVHHEAFTLVATVFNYLRQCLQVQVTLAESAELEVSAGSDEAYRGCVCADEERTFQWSVRATSLGEVNVTVIAEALSTEKLCGTEMPMVPAQGRVDTETKLLAVQVS
ncbi:A2MG protein, partial [Scopus umbretta]|nr:A2MG protein [Scopus umbretta]